MRAAPFEVRYFETSAAPGTDLSASVGRVATRTGPATRNDTEGVIALCTGITAPAAGVVSFAFPGESERVELVTAGSARCIVGAGATFTPGVHEYATMDAAGAVVPVVANPPAADTYIIGTVRYQNGVAKTAGQIIMVDVRPDFLMA